MLKRFASALALVAVLGLNAVAQECSGTSSCEVKVKAKSSCCQEATLAKKQDQEAPKKAECSTSSCGEKAKLAKVAECGEKTSCIQDAKVGSGCDKLDAYLALEKNCAKGCEASKAKLATLVTENPQLPEIAKLYQAACNGCEKSQAKLAALKAENSKKAEVCAESACTSQEAKLAKKQDCGSGCEKLDAYLALSENCAKGCETSKAKLASLVKDNPDLPQIAKLHQNAKAGCAKSQAKLASMKADAEKKAAKSCCEGGATKVSKDAKSACGEECSPEQKAACGSACEASQAVIVKPVKVAKKSDCCGGSEDCCDEGQAKQVIKKVNEVKEVKKDAKSSCESCPSQTVKTKS